MFFVISVISLLATFTGEMSVIGMQPLFSASDEDQNDNTMIEILARVLETLIEVNNRVSSLTVDSSDCHKWDKS